MKRREDENYVLTLFSIGCADLCYNTILTPCMRPNLPIALITKTLRMGTGLPPSAYTTIETDDGSVKLCKLITGLWQTSGRHGYSTDNLTISRQMAKLVEDGFCTYEIPVIKESAELIGTYRNLVGRRFADSQSQILMRIFLEPNAPDYPSRLYVEGLIDSGLTRMGGAERLDMVLLSWTEIDCIATDYRFCEVLHHCNEMRREGKVIDT